MEHPGLLELQVHQTVAMKSSMETIHFWELVQQVPSSPLRTTEQAGLQELPEQQISSMECDLTGKS